MESSDTKPMLPDHRSHNASDAHSQYGTVLPPKLDDHHDKSDDDGDDDSDAERGSKKLLHSTAHHIIVSPSCPSAASRSSRRRRHRTSDATDASNSDGADNHVKTCAHTLPYYVVYAVINAIISVPSLFGYAAVIFNHPVFQDDMNALSKLVIFSSMVHQLAFCLFSTLDFAIATVQDAGLVFLASMANTIATHMIKDNASTEAIVTTTVVLLACSTAALGLVLIVIGKLRLANFVSYLPMSVVGGYLAFIGFFCLQAGVSMSASYSLNHWNDWWHVLQSPRLLLLAAPALANGMVLTYVSRAMKSDAALPIVMVAVPAVFYAIMYMSGAGLDRAREAGWVGEEAPSVPFTELFKLIDFELVQWSLLDQIASTWVGMVFVVCFASSLDVAAISMDMGEVLDTNKELTTVGIGNLMSGLTLGFTGSYIFSQTIFTFRTGVHSRWIGMMNVAIFLYVVCSPVNILQIAPLFFLGSTLIYIGYELLIEWLFEVRHQVSLTEYGIIWLTFIAIHALGINAGIFIGILIAIVDQMVLTAQSANVSRIQKRSRAVWSREESKLLNAHGYDVDNASIMTLEVAGTVFFGSSLEIFNAVASHIGLARDESSATRSVNLHRSPHPTSQMFSASSRACTNLSTRESKELQRLIQRPPKFVVLDLLHVTNVDASGARGCFLQLAKLCAKQKMIVCAAGVTPKMEWMLRSHRSAFDSEEEDRMKGVLQSHDGRYAPCDRILIFVTTQEALEFCECVLLHRISHRREKQVLVLNPLMSVEKSIETVLGQLLHATDAQHSILNRFKDGRYHEEVDLMSGAVLFQRLVYPDAFYVVLSGGVANTTGSARTVFRQKGPVRSGAGQIATPKYRSSSRLLSPEFREQDGFQAGNKVVASLWSSGGILGYVDFLLERPRSFRALASQDGTRVAKITNSHINLLREEDEVLYGLLQQALLKASVADLVNCTCDDV